VDERGQHRLVPLDRFEELVRVDDATPRRLDGVHGRAGSSGDLGETTAEHAVHADDDGVTRFDEVDDDRLQPGAAGPRHREGHLVAGAEDRAELVGDLVEHRGELRVEVAEQRRRHRLAHRGVDVARARGP
jgi:hypothetical protein